jgi:hypothetical protein
MSRGKGQKVARIYFYFCVPFGAAISLQDAVESIATFMRQVVVDRRWRGHRKCDQSLILNCFGKAEIRRFVSSPSITPNQTCLFSVTEFAMAKRFICSTTLSSI